MVRQIRRRRFADADHAQLRTAYTPHFQLRDFAFQSDRRDQACVPAPKTTTRWIAADASSGSTEDSALMFRFFKQFFEILLPNHCPRVRAVAAGFRTFGNGDRLSVFHSFNLPFENSQVGRVDQIVGGVDGQQRGRDFFQRRAGIVIARAFHGVQHVVGVARSYDFVGVVSPVAFRPRRRSALA